MIKKTVEYVDFNGVERVEDCYFNLSKAEVTEMELSVEGGYSEYLKGIVASGDTSKILGIFKELILKSYGVKSEDGRRFIKSKELTEEFVQTEAYNEIFMNLALDEKASAEFVDGVMPKTIR